MNRCPDPDAWGTAVVTAALGVALAVALVIGEWRSTGCEEPVRSVTTVTAPWGGLPAHPRSTPGP